MAVATWQDVAVALGRPTSDFTADQQAQITYWLDGVELLIKSRLGPIADLDQDVLRFVETEVVAARFRRLSDGGASSITVAVDDGTVTRRFEAVSADDITDTWWDMLDPSRGASGWSTRPGFEPDILVTTLDWS
ncbi:hypothetical protein ACFJIY_07635 [Pimelobacter simplex]|uniref:hypothetical protein n=1 Tax=Nocardioides simplex TaxID=2045 RepID=UPI00366F4553